MNREIDDRTYLKFLLQSLSVDELKQICRDFEIKGFSRFKKIELIEFILDSLAEEEYTELLQQKELEIISKDLDLAFKKIRGEDRESISGIKVVNPDEHEIELSFKGFNWENTSFLSITPKNINDPERDCDCRIGSNMGFCNHFWVGFIYSLKQGWFNLEDWTLTPLPGDFEKKIKTIKLSEDTIGDVSDKEEKSITIIDDSAAGTILMKFINSPITVYDSKITKIVERESEFQGNVTRFFLVSLENNKVGPRVKKASDYREEELVDVEELKVRFSERLQSENSFKEEEKIKFNGKLVKDNFWGFMVKNVRKVDRL
jgi:hypothetical protein